MLLEIKIYKLKIWKFDIDTRYFNRLTEHNRELEKVIFVIW